MQPQEYVLILFMYLFANIFVKWFLRRYTTIEVKLGVDTKPSLIYRMEYEMDNVHLYKYEMMWCEVIYWWSFILFYFLVPIVNVVILKYQYTKVDYFFKSISLEDFYVELGARDLGTYFEVENEKLREVYTEETKVLTKMEELNRTFKENFTGSF